VALVVVEADPGFSDATPWRATFGLGKPIREVSHPGLEPGT
jgi:hypothetical protein